MWDGKTNSDRKYKTLSIRKKYRAIIVVVVIFEVFRSYFFIGNKTCIRYSLIYVLKMAI